MSKLISKKGGVCTLELDQVHLSKMIRVFDEMAGGFPTTNKESLEIQTILAYADFMQNDDETRAPCNKKEVKVNEELESILLNNKVVCKHTENYKDLKYIARDTSGFVHMFTGKPEYNGRTVGWECCTSMGCQYTSNFARLDHVRAEDSLRRIEWE